jgi:hypothetical protein
MTNILDNNYDRTMGIQKGIVDYWSLLDSNDHAFKPGETFTASWTDEKSLNTEEIAWADVFDSDDLDAAEVINNVLYGGDENLEQYVNVQNGLDSIGKID